MELPSETVDDNGPEVQPRALLFFAKISVVAIALHLCAYGVWAYVSVHRAIALVSIIILLPRFGWLLPTTIAGVILALWDSADEYATIASVGIGAFLLGCVLDYVAGRTKRISDPRAPGQSRDDAG